METSDLIEESVDATAVASHDAMTVALAELELVAQELARRRKARGLDYFVPNAPQLATLRSGARVLALVGGNRVGKTHLGAAWLSSHLTHRYGSCACHGDWFGPARRYTGKVKAVIVVTEFQKIETVIEPKLLGMLPQADLASIKRTPQGYLRRINLLDGSSVDVLSGEQDPMAFEGQDWDLAWIDEPTSQSRYVAVHRGLMDRAGLMLLTFTPLVEPWMKAEVVDKADEVAYHVVQADTYQNVEDIHGQPIQTREAIQFLERTMSDEERQTRIYGQFFHLRGLVYKEFLTGIHDREWTYQYPDPVLCVLDPHTRKPHWVIWAWVNRLDQLFVDRELVFDGTLKELGKAILLVEAQAGYRLRRRLIDPNYGRTPLITTGRTVIDELATKPFPVRFAEADDDKDAGIFQVKQRLSFNRHQPISLTNMPSLYFHRTRCPRTIHQMRSYQHQEWKGKTRHDRDPKEQTKALESDGPDCVRYLVRNQPRFDALTHQARSLELAEAPY